MNGTQQDIGIELAFAEPEWQRIVALRVPDGTLLGDALITEAIQREFPEIHPTSLVCGVFGRKRPADYVLREGDRVEIYRPLIADPKESRRRRAAVKGRGKG